MKDLLVRLLEWIIGRNVAIVYSRLYTYKKTSDECPFCKEGEGRTISKCNPPYPRTQDHLLLTPDLHILKRSHLTDEERLRVKDVRIHYISQGYMILAREYPHCGASVEHLHLHLIKPE